MDRPVDQAAEHGRMGCGVTSGERAVATAAGEAAVNAYSIVDYERGQRRVGALRERCAAIREVVPFSDPGLIAGAENLVKQGILEVLEGPGPRLPVPWGLDGEVNLRYRARRRGGRHQEVRENYQHPENGIKPFSPIT
jgi:hypothetical protein